jgi:glycosyltransferase involved in cell wall biosynthesis
MIDKIAFVITTFERDNLLIESINSLLPYMQNKWKMIIIDQSKEDKKWNESKELVYYKIPYNSGLSYARNFGVQKAYEMKFDYTVISSDSFVMNESILNLQYIIDNYMCYYDLIGFELDGCICSWEAYLKLIPGDSFELDFIDKTKKEMVYDCDIVRNFFIAETKALMITQWDTNLKLCEHEDFFWRFKEFDEVGWTSYISAFKQPDRPNNYASIREENFRNGRAFLMKKYGINKWVTYKNLDRSKRKRTNGTA